MPITEMHFIVLVIYNIKGYKLDTKFQTPNPRFCHFSQLDCQKEFQGNFNCPKMKHSLRIYLKHVHSKLVFVHVIILIT